MIPRARIGGLTIGCQGYGAMGISEFYGVTDASEARRSLDTAFDLGVSYFDTADMYGGGHNEEFLREFIADHRADVVIGTKFGIVRDRRDPTRREIDNSARHIRHSVEASMSRLGVDVIDVYWMHRKDPRVPIADTVGVLGELVSEGKVREIGLSEVTAGELRDAHHVHPVAAVQTEWSLFSRDAERQVVPQAAELGITVVAYSPLSRGLLTDTPAAAIGTSAGDMRRSMPRFSRENLDHNRGILEPLHRIATDRGVTSAQIALAWVHSRARVHSIPVVPIPGTRRPARVVENVAASMIDLTGPELAGLDPIHADVAGDRYPDLTFTYLTRQAASL